MHRPTDTPAAKFRLFVKIRPVPDFDEQPKFCGGGVRRAEYGMAVARAITAKNVFSGQIAKCEILLD